jgi:phage terminase large subunit GpA-like protein
MSKPVYKVNLSDADKEGKFPCPRCGTEINPKVEDKEIYDVVEVRMKNNEINSAIIDCKKCSSEIELEFFS